MNPHTLSLVFATVRQTKRIVLFNIMEKKMDSFKIKRIFLLTCLFGLSACSSKPEDADIQKEMAEAFNCPIFELSDVKKVDGAEVDNKHYDVAFTYTLSIKGGQPAATNLFAEWLFLSNQLREAGRYETRAMIERNNEQEEKMKLIKHQIYARIDTLMPCKTALADARAGAMFTEFALDVKSGQDKVAMPLAEKIHGVGRMRKTESGWHFVDMPNLSLKETVKSEPVAYPKFKPLVADEPQPAAAENNAPPSQPSPIETTPSR
jgi:ribosomal protein S6E (S10)